MTPDAGSSKAGTTGGGFAVMPQVGDRVMVGFLYNNPDRPFVMGSLFNGKSAPDGKIRSLTDRETSAHVSIDGGAINIIDKGGHSIKLDGAGNITIDASTTITLKVGGSSIKIESSKITIKADTVNIDSTNAEVLGKSKAVLKSDAASFTADPSSATMKGPIAEVKGDGQAKIGGPMVIVNSSGPLILKGATVMAN